MIRSFCHASHPGLDRFAGGWTDLVLHDVEGEGRIRQLTTSAIANKQTRPHQALAVALTRGFLSSLDVSETGSGWTSRHYDWTNLNNYAFVSAGMAVAGTLKVKVLKAQGLKNQDMLSWLDPYVTLTVGSQTFQTHSDSDDQRDRSSPEWNSEDFQFTVGPSDYYCKLQVCDEDSLMGQDLGSVKLAIHELDTCTQTLVETWFQQRQSRYGMGGIMKTGKDPAQKGFLGVVASHVLQISAESLGMNRGTLEARRRWICDEKGL
ncbi:unnamed protein product, partial [Symbiodinium necroappetens]